MPFLVISIGNAVMLSLKIIQLYLYVLMIHNPSILYCEAANQVHEPLSTLFGDMLFQSKKAVLAGFWAINSSLCFGLHQSDRSFRTDKCCSLWLWCKSSNWIWFSWTNSAMLSNLCSSLNYVLTGRLTPWHFFRDVSLANPGSKVYGRQLMF